MNTDLSIAFIKENCHTIGDLKKRVDERSVVVIGRCTQESPVDKNTTEVPQTFNFTKIKQAKDNIETENVFKDLGIEIL